MSTAGASILAVGYLLPLFYFLWSLKCGQAARAQSLGAPPAWNGSRLAAAARIILSRRPW